MARLRVASGVPPTARGSGRARVIAALVVAAVLAAIGGMRTELAAFDPTGRMNGEGNGFRGIRSDSRGT